MPRKIRVLVIGAHPDDCDIAAGGLAALYVKHGHVVQFVSMTNGDTGHYQMAGGELARRRYAETQRSAKVLGIKYLVRDQHCGELMPTLEARKDVIRIIREFKPDIVLTHTPDDYHPDHRYTSILVQDSAYSVTVPGQCPLTPHLMRNPVYAYCCGTVTTSGSFRPDVIVDLDKVIGKKLAMINCHESQWYEWIPYNQGYLDKVPKGAAARRRWNEKRFRERLKGFANQWRDRAIDQYGPERGKEIQYAEGVQASPFGAPLDAKTVRRLFPFLAKKC
ncbi:MAG: PIG-L family deacetylase [Planctomycetes bacterium]|nr:PIG-L family deacetylase [Planctomycetota bacterium]